MDVINSINWATVVAVLFVAACVFFAVRYIYKEKKRGAKCVGCPFASSCEKYQQQRRLLG